MAHGGIANLILGVQARFGDVLPVAGKRWAVATNYSFDQWVEHIFLSLVTGGCGVLISDPTALVCLNKDDLFDAFYAVPSVYAAMQAMSTPLQYVQTMPHTHGVCVPAGNTNKRELLSSQWRGSICGGP